jgi:hypothetical protein
MLPIRDSFKTDQSLLLKRNSMPYKFYITPYLFILFLFGLTITGLPTVEGHPGGAAHIHPRSHIIDRAIKHPIEQFQKLNLVSKSWHRLRDDYYISLNLRDEIDYEILHTYGDTRLGIIDKHGVCTRISLKDPSHKVRSGTVHKKGLIGADSRPSRFP